MQACYNCRMFKNSFPETILRRHCGSLAAWGKGIKNCRYLTGKFIWGLYSRQFKAYVWGSRVLLYVVFWLPFLKAVPAGFNIALDLGQLDYVIECTKEKMDRNLYLESDSKRYRLPEETEGLTRLILFLIRLSAAYMFWVAQHSCACTGSWRTARTALPPTPSQPLMFMDSTDWISATNRWTSLRASLE